NDLDRSSNFERWLFNEDPRDHPGSPSVALRIRRTLRCSSRDNDVFPHLTGDSRAKKEHRFMSVIGHRGALFSFRTARRANVEAGAGNADSQRLTTDDYANPATWPWKAPVTGGTFHNARAILCLMAAQGEESCNVGSQLCRC